MTLCSDMLSLKMSNLAIRCCLFHLRNSWKIGQCLADFEKSYITKVLNHCNWKIAGKDGSAVILGLPPSTLRSKMKKLGITPVST